MARSRPIVSYFGERGDQDVEAQRQAVQAFVRGNGYRVVEEFVDKGSALRSRIRLRAALDCAQRASCPVLVSGFDWLSRHAGVVKEFAVRDVPLIVAGETPVVVRPYRGWSEFERLRHGQNIKDALAVRKAAGVRLGNPVNLHEAGVQGRETQIARAETFAASVMPIIDEIRSGGVTSINAIAKELNRRGVKTARGGDFAAMSVKRVVERGGS
jgi:DNA invertase Pin-like site-specific DNA recombinase